MNGEISTNQIEHETLPYFLFTVGKNVYGINSEFVKSIEILDGVTPIVDSGPSIRGGLLYQNQFIPLVDMRKLFGLASQVEEFEQSVSPEQRIEDHERWVSELERSVLNRTEFTLTDDHHQCALGKWYDSFHTENNLLKHQLSTLEAPHEEVHKTAKLVKRLMKNEKYDEALAAVREMKKTHYKKTVQILSSLRTMVETNLRELYLVIHSTEGLKGVIVDSIVGIEFIDRTMYLPESIPISKHIESFAQRKGSDSVVMIVRNSFL